MADFCKQCSEDMFGEDFGDLAGFVDDPDITFVLCEGCGFNCMVNSVGECVSADCLKRHGHLNIEGNGQ